MVVSLIDKRMASRHDVSMSCSPGTDAKYDRWLDRALRILDGKANGLGMPVLRALALRGHIGAMVELANRQVDREDSAYDFARGYALERLIARREGLSYQIENLATTQRNRGNMAGYRYWLARAGRLGDPDVQRERRRFQTRFPYAVMKRWRRYRPYRAKIDNYLR